MTNDSTKPEFFSLWSVRQLQIECARLNGVLKECSEIADRAGAISSYEQTGALDEYEPPVPRDGEDAREAGL